MARASKRMLAHAWMFVAAALLSLAFGGITLADEPQGSGDVLAVAEQVAAPAPAPAPEPAPAPVTPDAQTAPAPEAPPAEPSPPAGEQATGEPPASEPAPAPEGAPAPDASEPEPPATEPQAANDDASEDQAEEPNAPAAGVGGKASASRAKRENGATTAQNSFSDNPCRTSRTSEECAQFLYPGTCLDTDSAECREFLAVNPCARDVSSESCEAYIENACFERPNGPACLFIRGALTEPGNPCRQNPNSQECNQHASQEQCDFRGLSGLDCSIFLAFLRSFTAEEAAACASMLNPQNGRPAAGSICELYVAVFRLACDKDAFICIVPFGGSRESLGRPGVGGGGGGGGGGSDEGTLGGGREGLLGSRGGGQSRADLLISDPGAAGNLGGRAGGDGRGRRGRDRDRPLAQTGKDLDQFILLGLMLFGAGAALRLRARRRSGKTELAAS